MKPSDSPAAFSSVAKWLDEPTLLARLDAHRRDGRTVVFTNGCFDLLHVGHVRYLHSARRLGDVLVVGLNSDESVTRIKGPNRPLHPLAERAEMLCALSAVTYVVTFDTDSVEPLIRRVRPDVLAKGGDYAKKEVVGAEYVQEYGGSVEVLDLVPGRSTTEILNMIQRAQ